MGDLEKLLERQEDLIRRQTEEISSQDQVVRRQKEAMDRRKENGTIMNSTENNMDFRCPSVMDNGKMLY